MLIRNARRFEFEARTQVADGTEASRRAIAEFYAERVGELDIRHVWDRNSCQFFRVNFWGTDVSTGGPMIRRSAFVVADVSEGSIIVREVN